MSGIDIVLAALAALMTFTTLQVTGIDRRSWDDRRRTAAYVSLILFGLAVVGVAVWGDGSTQTSAIGAGFAVGLLTGTLVQWYRNVGRARDTSVR